MDAIFDAKDGNDNISETKIATTFAKRNELDNKVNLNGSNATDPGVTAMLDKLTNKVVKADGTNLDNDKVASILNKLTDKVVQTSQLATPDVVNAITASPDFTQKVYIKANPADEVYTKTDADTEFLKTSQLPTKVAEKAVVDLLVPALAAGSDDSGIYTKKSMDDELVKKADTTNVYAKAAADTAFVKTSELATPAVVDAITASPNFTNKVYIKATPPDEVYTKTVANTTFAKVDGSNSTEASVNAMLGKLTGDNAVVKAPALTTKVNVDGSNATGLGVTAMLGTLTDTVVKTSELPTKVATQAVVNVLVPELAKGANDLGIYTKKGVDDALVSKFTNDATFKTQVIENTLRDPGFQNTVREVISQPVFDIPTDPSAPISVDW